MSYLIRKVTDLKWKVSLFGEEDVGSESVLIEVEMVSRPLTGMYV